MDVDSPEYITLVISGDVQVFSICGLIFPPLSRIACGQSECLAAASGSGLPNLAAALICPYQIRADTRDRIAME
jgi:hypothetical protein